MLQHWNEDNEAHFYANWLYSLSIGDFYDYTYAQLDVCTLGYLPL